MNRYVKGTILFLWLFMCFFIFSCKANAVISKTNDKEDNTGKRVYFAAALFNEMEREYNLRIASILTSYGYDVFMPQRDGYEEKELKGKTQEEITELIFKKDIEEIEKADILFAILDGAVPDEGMCVEIGIAYAKGKRCYGLRNDMRTSERGFDLNIMITGCCEKIFNDEDYEKMIDSLKDYLSKNKL